MKNLFALTGLFLSAALSLHASEHRHSTIGRPAPHADRLDLTMPVISGQGKLSPAVHAPVPGWDIGVLPRWQIRLGGKAYPLVFDGNKPLEELAALLNGEWVKVRGRLEQRNFGLSRLPRADGRPVTDDGRQLPLIVFVVESMEATGLENARPDRPVRITVQATIGWFGNTYGRMSNGVIVSTLKGCPWEGCYIVLNGRTVRVEGLPGDIVEQQGYRGQTLVLVGRLVQQAGDPEVPADVLIVESFRRG